MTLNVAFIVPYIFSDGFLKLKCGCFCKTLWFCMQMHKKGLKRRGQQYLIQVRKKSYFKIGNVTSTFD